MVRFEGESTHVFLCGADDSKRNLGTNVANARQTRIHQLARRLIRVQRPSQSDGRLLDHGIGDVLGVRQDGPKTNTGEDVHIVALAWLVHATFVFDGMIRAPRSEEDGTIGPADGISVVDLAQRYRV